MLLVEILRLLCFDERSQFGHTITEGGFEHTTNGRNVLIFGADMSFSVHANNGANHIYLMGDGLTQAAESKIPSITGLATKAEITAVANKIPSLVGYAKKREVATDIAAIKNDYVTNASLTSQLNDLKAQHIADEVKKVDD